MTDPNDPAELATENLGAYLLDQIVAELERQAVPFSKMAEIDQERAIDRLRVVVRNAVTETMRTLFRGEYPACTATLEAAQIKGRIVVRLTVDKSAASRHELLDAIGSSVVVLMADPETYLAGLEKVKAKAKQGDLFSPRADLPQVPDMPDDELGLGEDDPPAPPNPEDVEDNWTSESWGVDRNAVTGTSRVSQRKLAEDLIEAVTDWNAQSSNPSIEFVPENVKKQPRRDILLALQWLETYTKGESVEQLVRPEFLQPTYRV